MRSSTERETPWWPKRGSRCSKWVPDHDHDFDDKPWLTLIGTITIIILSPRSPSPPQRSPPASSPSLLLWRRSRCKSGPWKGFASWNSEHFPIELQASIIIIDPLSFGIFVDLAQDCIDVDDDIFTRMKIQERWETGNMNPFYRN